MPEVCLRGYRHGECGRSTCQQAPNHRFSPPINRPGCAIHALCRTRFQYQNKVETAYRLLPRPPQTPAAPFKRLP
jgi:hypothetical protein